MKRHALARSQIPDLHAAIVSNPKKRAYWSRLRRKNAHPWKAPIQEGVQSLQQLEPISLRADIDSSFWFLD